MYTSHAIHQCTNLHHTVQMTTYSHKPAQPAALSVPHGSSLRPSAVSFCNITQHLSDCFFSFWSSAKGIVFEYMYHQHVTPPSHPFIPYAQTIVQCSCFELGLGRLFVKLDIVLLQKALQVLYGEVPQKEETVPGMVSVQTSLGTRCKPLTLLCV